MVSLSDRRVLFLLSGLAAMVALCVAGYGLLNLDVYQPMTPDSLMPGTVSQDLISVIAAVGLLLCIALVRRGQEWAWLIWVGLLGYVLYAYALYCFERVYNPLFLGYVATFGLCVYALIGFFRSADLAKIELVAGRKAPPRRAAAVLFLALVALFLFLWLSILIPAMRDRLAPDGSSIFVLDLSFFLPLLVIEAVLLFKRRPLGDALAIPILIKVGTLGLSVLLGALVAPWFGQDIDVASVGIYALLGVGPIALVCPFWRTLRVGHTQQKRPS